MTSTTVLRHVSFEDLGAFAPVLERRGAALDICDVGLDDFGTLDPLSPDLLIVLGGPIGVYEEERYPFLVDETSLITRRIGANRPTLGICLGAQLIAKAAGAKVYPSGLNEIGFAPITLTDAGRSSCLAPLAGEPMTLHWHGDTFELPGGATLLASTEACTNQAFMLGPNIIGFQFRRQADLDSNGGSSAIPWS
jgi:GMP synthase (glutamine-hydrolysing)